MSAEREKPSDLQRALHEARRVLRGATPTLDQRAVALSVLEQLDRALVARVRDRATRRRRPRRSTANGPSG